MKKPLLYSYVFGAAGILITAVMLAGVYLPMWFSTPFLQAVRASFGSWGRILFLVPACSLAGILRCHAEWHEERGGSALWWLNYAACLGLLIWSVCMLALGGLLALFLKNWSR